MSKKKRYKDDSGSYILAWIISILIILVAMVIVEYIKYKPIGFNTYFLGMVAGTSILIGIVTLVIELIVKSRRFITKLDADRVIDRLADNSKAAKIILIGVLLILIIIVLNIISSPLFNSKSYHNCIEVEQVSEDKISENLPTEDMLNQISLMDTSSAAKLGDRTLGSLSDLVSQYQVGAYTTICVDGKIKKIAPLEYTSFFKWINNRSIPGYVLVDPLTNDAEFVRCEKPMVYSPSAYFNEDVLRHCRFKYPTTYFSTYCFQIDDQGNPYWAVTTVKPKSILKNFVPTGVILVDASTGEMEKYSLDDIPEWVDNVFTGNVATNLYNRYGNYINGYWNTMMSQKGITQTTDDFGYIAIDNDVYIYTGVTSISSDESNLGFILTNSRTGEYKYYGIPGAEEYSAMGAAEGLVQNYGYHASFPSLVSINDEPTYVMVLKDNNGLVKQYAMVNYKNYTLAVVNNTLEASLKDYLRILNMDDEEIGEETEVETGEDAVKEPAMDDGKVRITNIQFITEDGNTNCYIATTEGHVYYAEFDPELLLLEEGQEFEDKGYELVR